MVNETVQWAVLVLVVLLVLGVLRQISVMLPPTSRAVSSGPPVGRHLPKHLYERLRNMPELLNGDTILAFVTEACTGCQRLLASIEEPAMTTARRHLALVAKAPSEPFREALAETGVPTIEDSDGTIWAACQVSATPLVVRVDSTGRVRAKEVTHRVDALVA